MKYTRNSMLSKAETLIIIVIDIEKCVELFSYKKLLHEKRVRFYNLTLFYYYIKLPKSNKKLKIFYNCTVFP